MSLDITVRQLSPDDWESFARVRLECLRESPEAFTSRYEAWVNASESQWRQRLGSVAGNWMALVGEAPVGLVSGSLPGDGSSQLMSMYVSEDVRGHGIGERLVETVVGWAGRQEGVGRIGLTVFENNLRAQKFYLRNGFSFTGPETGEPRHERRMVRSLER